MDTLKKLNVELEVVGKITDDYSVIFVGNHISYLDIPLLMARAKNISFVAKQELKSWPVFGEAAKKIDTVFVKRDSADSRKSARQSVQEAVSQGKRVVIFPSGTTCMYEDKPWKKGAFHIAHDTNSLIQPFRISYAPMRLVAYIDKDFFPLHLYNLCRSNKAHGKTVKAKIEFHEPIKVTNPGWDCLHWHCWSKGMIKG